MSRIAAITGATGFIGQELVHQLASLGWQVRALTRRSLPETTAPNIKWIAGDFTNKQALSHLVQDADAVFHVAGAVKARRRSHFFEANANSVNAMVAAVQDTAPACRFVLVSSIAARTPYLSDYAASKARGEAALQAQGSAINWSIIRPPAVYGPGDMEILTLFRYLNFGVGIVPGRSENRLSLIHVRDLCNALVAIIDLPAARQRILDVDDGHDQGYTLTEIFHLGAAILHKTPRLVTVPKLALLLAAGVNKGVSTLTGGVPMLTPGKVHELCHPDWVCRGDKIPDFCEWYPQIKAETGLRETLIWYRERGYL